jgi:adenylate cyclase
VDAREISDSLFFDGFRLDCGALFRLGPDGAVEPVRLGSRALDLLWFLAQRPGQLVPKDAIMEAVWPETAVEESNLTVQISALRRVLDIGRAHSSCIQTISGRGYRFIPRIIREPRSTVIPSASSGVGDALPLHKIRLHNIDLADQNLLNRSLLSNIASFPISERPTLAVLPFINLSPRPKNDHFSEIITDEIVTALVRSGAVVPISGIARLVSADRELDITQIGERLEAGYLLKGNIRRNTRRIHLNIQLIDVRSLTCIWGNVYERSITEIFDFQSEIGQAVVREIIPVITDAELRRVLLEPEDHSEAWDAYQKGRWYLRQGTLMHYRRARCFFERAIHLDRTFAPAYVANGHAIAAEGNVFYSRSLDEALALKQLNVFQALDVAPTNVIAQAALSSVILNMEDHEGALNQARAAVARDQYSFHAQLALGRAALFSGQPAEGRSALLRCRRLNWQDAHTPSILCQIGMSYYFEHDYDAAAQLFQETIATFPHHSWAYRWLTAALGKLNQIEDASKSLNRAIAVSPNSFHVSARNRAPWMRLPDYVHMLEGLRNAGWKG